MNITALWNMLAQVINNFLPLKRIVFNFNTSTLQFEVLKEVGWFKPISLNYSGDTIIVTSQQEFPGTSGIDITIQPSAGTYEWISTSEIRVTPVGGVQNIATIWITVER